MASNLGYKILSTSSIHGASLAFFFNQFFKNLAHHEIFSHKLATYVV
jgi:hypothetical protein